MATVTSTSAPPVPDCFFDFDGPSRLLGFREKETVPLLLTELQIKF